MSTISEQVARLSPAKQKLFELRQKRHAASVKQYPLSYGQKRLWLVDQMDPGNPAYNIVRAVRLEGPLNIAALQHALTEMVRRHEILRTRFRMAEGVPFQEVVPPFPQPLEWVDLSRLTSEQQEHACSRILEAEADRRFDLSQGGLFIAQLAHMDPLNHLLVLNTHHILSDGWSTTLLVQELSALYSAYSRGEKPALPEPVMQYKDFAVWQEQWLQSEWFQRQIDYWRQQLADCDESLELPFDYPRVTGSKCKGAAKRFAIDRSTSDELRRQCRDTGTTLFMALLAVFNALLFRYSGQSSITVGTPIAGRNRIELENLIGFLVNTLVMHSRFSPGLSAAELLRQVRSNVLAAHANQEVPFEMLVELLRPERDANHNPLFQVMFVFQNLPPAKANLPDLVVRTVSLEKTSTKFDLTLTINEQDSGLSAILDYRDDLFAPATIERLTGHFQTLLKAMIAFPDQPVSRLPLLTSAEWQQVVVDWNDTCLAGENLCMHQVFEQQVERTPEAVAVQFHGKQLSYRELNQRANQLARHLQKNKVGPEVKVGLLMERSLELVIAALAVMKAGGAYVPLDPSYPAERLRYMVETAGPAILLTEKREEEKAHNLYSGMVLVLDEKWREFEGYNKENVRSAVHPENLAYVIYTSGSTGQPKGVCIEHRQVGNYVRAMIARMGKKPCSFAMAQPLTVDASVTALFPPLATGGCVHVISREWSLDVECMRELFAERKMQGLKIAPLHLATLHRAAGEKKNEVMPTDLLVVGGEVSPWAWLQELQEMAPECAIFNQYGPTETAVAVLVYRLGEEGAERKYENAPLGRPLGNTQIYILNDDLQPAPAGVKGEIYIGGGNVGRGYLLQAAMTGERFIPNPFSSTAGERLYRTGDYGKWTTAGQVEFLGRGDDQVKIRGFRIESSEIQSVLARHPEVAETVIQSWQDGSERRLAAYVVCRGTYQPEASELRDYLSRYLPEYMIPAAFIFLDSLPLTPHGKLDRRSLPLPASSHREIATQYVGPLTDVQSRLGRILSELLGVENIGIHDNFFELGGHSLLATRVIARVRSEFAVEIQLRAMFEDPTIARLERRIEQERSKGETTKQPEFVRSDNNGPKPLSYAQQRLWFLQQLDPASVAYNMPYRLRIRGPLNRQAMQAAFNELARRHEILRTQFVQQDENPVQVVAPEAFPLIEHVDLRGCEDQEQETTRLAAKTAQTAFDLQKAPLLWIKLVQLSDVEHVLVLNMHHIISDGWSMGIILREVTTLYNAYASGTSVHLKEIPIQYGDYAVAHREWLQGEVLEDQVAYWRQELAGATILELPTEYEHGGTPSSAGTTLRWAFSQELSGRLRQLCDREEATLFMALMAGFQIILSRYTGQDDISVATPISGRRWSETENLIGFFVNTLVLRARIKKRMRFREMLRQVRETALKAYAHQDLPFEKLVEELQPDRDLNGVPLFKVMFILQNTPRTQLQAPGLKVSMEPLSSGNQKFAMVLGAVDGQRIDGGISYRSELFSAEMIRRMLGHWENLLLSVVATPEAGLDDLSLLSVTEREQILQEWNRTQMEFPLHTVHALFEQQAARTPYATAVEYEDESFSYDELNRRANQVAHYLKKLGAGPEMMIGICMERSLEMVIAMLGVLKAGAAYVPLDPDYPTDRLAYMVESSRAPVVLLQQAFRKQWAALARTTALDHEWDEIARESDTNPEVPMDIHNPAYVIYTSGSTGRPKGVVITHAALANHMQWINETFAIHQRDRVLQKTAFSFDASVWEFYAPLLTGGCLVLARPGGQRDRDYLLHCLAEKRITIVQFVPSQLQMLVEIEGLEQCRCLRRAYCGGEPLSMALVKRLHERAPWVKLCNLYGPTEATIDSVFEECRVEEDRGMALIGRPVANLRAYVLSQDMEPVPACVWGELFLGGAGLARGYAGQLALTAERFVPDPFSRTGGERLYRTGDIVRWRGDGKLEFAGRRDHQVKLRGFRIELKEIEVVLAQYEAVAESVVVVRGEPGNERLVAYVVLKKGPEAAELKEGEIRRHLQKKLPHYMQPATIVALEKWPLTPNGKIDRANLPEPESMETMPREESQPQTPETKLLCEIWKEVLKIKTVGIHDDFFRLGGHSLLATQLVSRIKRAFHLEVPLRVLFEAPTVIEQAAWIEAQRREQSTPVTQFQDQAISRAQAIEMKKGTLALPLFFVPGAGGGLSTLRQLADHLSPEDSFFVFQDPAFDEPNAGKDSIEAMAAEYVECMQQRQPAGPYLLGGWSVGGLIAFEMARQLLARNQTVNLLALVDSYPPAASTSSREEDDAVLLKSFLLTNGFLPHHLKQIRKHSRSLEQGLRHALRIGRKANVLPPDLPAEAIKRFFGIYRRYVLAGRSFKLPSVDLTAHLWRAAESRKSGDAREMRWKLAVRKLHLHDVPGDHFSILQPPHVAVLAKQLSSEIRQANARTARNTSAALKAGSASYN